MLHVLNIIFCLFLSMQGYSQSFVYSRNYFRWPVDNKPGIVANFGELRSNHWHMGLDVRTDQKVNMPVYAAADGYISKVTVMPYGYGQAIFINHPNGLTTVYGHLNRFFPKLDSVVTAEQYKQQSWSIELNFIRSQFPVRKGQFIAYSGNTGGSQGPHVHFEIRNTQTDRCINPFFFDLPVPDAVPPVFIKLAMYNRSASVYDQSPFLFPVKKVKGKFLLRDSLIKTNLSKVSFAIDAYDCVSGVTNPNGIYSGKIFFDGRPLVEFVLDSMDYDETDYINAHIDYKYRYKGGAYLQQLFKLPGDNGRVYRLREGDGTINLNDTNAHAIKIEISDIKQNTSELNFAVQYNGDLSSINSALEKSFAPGLVNIFEQNDFEIYLGEDCLYDSIQPVFARTEQPAADVVSPLFHFSDASIPIHGQINVRIKTNVEIPQELVNKLVIKRTGEKGSSYRKANWQKDWVAARFNDLGSYQVFVDTTSPTINELGKSDTIDLSASERIVFYPKDNIGIKNFKAELDGQWLMFSNDKGAAWIYNFDERCPYGVHNLRVRTEDIVGNEIQKEWWFKRYPYTPPKKTVHKKKGSSKKHVTNQRNKSTGKKK